MKILIVNGYVRENKGDAALISVLAEQLQTAFPAADVTIAGMEDPIEHPEFYGFKNIGSLHLYVAGIGTPRSVRLYRKIFTTAVVCVWPILPFRKFLTQFLPNGIKLELVAINEADLVVSASGGYLIGKDSVSSSLNLFYAVAPIRLAERIGKPVILAPQSFGPLKTNWQKKTVLKAVNNAQLIFVREDRSYEFLKKIGAKEDVMVRAVDSGFAHKARSTPENIIHNYSAKIHVGITARKWLKDDQQKKYEIAIAGFIRDAEKKHNAQIILIPQVTSASQNDDDRVVEARIKSIAEQMGAHPIQIIEEIDHYDIKKLYSGFDFMVGTRFHSIIFSLTSYVPAIAIEYEYKTSGIMHDLGLDAWVIRMEDVTTEKLNNLFERLLKEKNEYRRHIQHILPPYIARTDEVPNQIKKIYKNFDGGKVLVQ